MLSFHVVCDFSLCCLCVFVCGPTSCAGEKSNHLTVKLPCDKLKESVFSSLSVIVQLISTQCPPHPSERPISLLSASLQSKWNSVFDVQASFEPLWEMKLKFVNRGPCSLLLPSLPHVGGKRLRNVICWLQMSSEEGAALLRNTVAPRYSELF